MTTDEGPITITDAAKRIRSGELTPSSLLEICLARIDRYEPKVRAWVYLDRERARREAELLTKELKEGLDRGPLQGIPIGIKDIIDVYDMPTGCGSKMWANSYARRDATCVERLRQAGALILGKTVTTAYAYLDPPVTRNPWNLERTPGGSSSGSAAAVACGMCLGALATQTGGSTIRPAAYCGVCALKPTYGRVSVDGVLPLAPSLDHVGVMANCVRDLALLFQVIAGTNADLSLPTLPDVRLELDLLIRANPSTDHDICVYRLGGMFRDRAQSIMWDILNDAFSDFLRSEKECVSHQSSVPPAGFADVPQSHLCVMAVEAAEYHAERIARRPDEYPPRIAELVHDGKSRTAVEYRSALALRDQLRIELDNSLSSRRSVYLTPATTGPVPTPETTGDPSMNSPWSFLGMPTVTLPASRHLPGKPPLGIQLTASSGNEMNLLAVAARFEASIGEYERTLPPVPA
jgi:aspartyl-tRNA(Asn)/glutamyl-tRNA(Gln) amidotransferase subunit A